MEQWKTIWSKYRQVIIGGGVLILVVVPIIIYLLSVIPLFPNGGNDWAGFWSGYIGTLIGSGVTLFVLSETLKNNRESLMDTLQNDRELQKRNEMIVFCDYLIRQNTQIIENIEETYFQAGVYIASRKEWKLLIEVSKQSRVAKSLVLEMISQLECREKQEKYLPKEFQEMLQWYRKMHSKLNHFIEDLKEKSLQANKSSEEEEAIIAEMEQFEVLIQSTTGALKVYIQQLLK